MMGMEADPSRPGSPQLDLWASVIGQAIRDAFKPARALTSDPERRDALRFLLEKTGTWAQSRRDLCDLLGLNPEVLRQWAMSALTGEVPVRLSVDGGVEQVTPEHIAEARSIWEEMNRPPKPKAAGPKKSGPTPAAPKWLCFLKRPDGVLWLPSTARMQGAYNGLPLPTPPSFQSRILRAVTKPSGATLDDLSKVPSWENHAEALCKSYGLELVFKSEGRRVASIADAETIHLRRHPQPAA